MQDWETPDLREQTEQLWQQLKPFYTKIHAYVRMKLSEQYPREMNEDGTIPAHLTGNMWAQEWGGLMEKVDGIDPYPDLQPIDVSDALKKQVFTSK